MLRVKYTGSQHPELKDKTAIAQVFCFAAGVNKAIVQFDDTTLSEIVKGVDHNHHTGRMTEFVVKETYWGYGWHVLPATDFTIVDGE